jgi:hypothetical protein
MSDPEVEHPEQPASAPPSNPSGNKPSAEAGSDDDDWIPFRSTRLIRRRGTSKQQPPAQNP